MAQRTYMPTLLFIARGLIRYCDKYDEKIREGLAVYSIPEVLYDTLLDALRAFVYTLGDAMPPDGS